MLSRNSHIIHMLILLDLIDVIIETVTVRCAISDIKITLSVRRNNTWVNVYFYQWLSGCVIL